MGSSGPRAIVSKYSIYMLATTGEHGEPIAVPCSCLKNLSRKVKNTDGETRPSSSPWNRKWDTEVVLHLSTLLPRVEWILQENLQVHTNTGLFQRSQHLKIHADAPKWQSLQQPEERSSLPLGVQGRWMQLLLHWKNLQGSWWKSQRTLQVYNLGHTETLQGFPLTSSLNQWLQHNRHRTLPNHKGGQRGNPHKMARP